jgi:hypothetical protein
MTYDLTQLKNQAPLLYRKLQILIVCFCARLPKRGIIAYNRN